jgi:hypothetical protein
MTTLAEFLATQPSLAELQSNWIVASKELRDALLAKQATLTTNHIVNPVELTDGRYGACCDVLSASGDGHIFNPLFQLLDQGNLMVTEVVDTAAFKALLPEPTEEI